MGEFYNLRKPSLTNFVTVQAKFVVSKHYKLTFRNQVHHCMTFDSLDFIEIIHKIFTLIASPSHFTLTSFYVNLFAFFAG